jgi:hypothetical protein
MGYMKSLKQRGVAAVLSLCLASGFMLTGCEQIGDAVGGAVDAATSAIKGDVRGEVGTTYSTRWFDFSIDSVSIASTYGDYAAEQGNTLAVVRVTEKLTYDSPQPFGTYDWFLDDDAAPEYIYPLDPFNDTMMPLEFTLSPNESVTYDIVFEYPETFTAPILYYIEADTTGDTYATFTVPIK